MVRAYRVCQDNYYMQGFMILAFIGTEKDTLVLTKSMEREM